MRAALLVTASLLAFGRQATVDDALDRLDDYLEKYERELSAVVADEELIQETDGRVTRKLSRRLRSEIAFLRLPGNLEWLGFRSVRSVDGKPLTGVKPLTEVLARGAPKWSCACRATIATRPGCVSTSRKRRRSRSSCR